MRATRNCVEDSATSTKPAFVFVILSKRVHLENENLAQ
ncbi:Uncharacterised protein [Legionella pneumophila]|nr:hypothetical protein [Legionella pneumophila subsp. pneumophila]CZH03792.1 Uncharacterised protein [Legionella pneumophila]CZH10241.1 Uncharacterised protein [Legionella pneumophila]CZH31232.1 Uncharacterised protein [Legionella pneumophila]CZH46527.1 Uncharacterised protein [Legionella pneumophila]